LIATAILFAPSGARADLILSFAPDGLPTQFFVPVGQSVVVPVYLVQTNNAPLTNALVTEGLISAGVRVDFTNTLPGGATATAATSTLPSFFNNFGFPAVDNTNNFAAFSAGTLNATFPSGAPPAIQVGRFTFTGNTVGNVTTLMTTNPHTPNFAEFTSAAATPTIFERQPYGNIFWAAGNPPPPVGTGVPVHYTTTITVTPEPVAIMSVCAMVGGVVAWRRRK
jgi:hypothetical protein